MSNVLFKNVIRVMIVSGIALLPVLTSVGCSANTTPQSTGSDSQESSQSQSSENVEVETDNLPEVKQSVDAYSWDELSEIAAVISEAGSEDAAIDIAKRQNLTTADGKLDGTQTKSIVLSDGTDVAVQITGFYHDDKTSGGKAGITFIFKDAIAYRDMNPYDMNSVDMPSSGTNSGGWKDSQMRSWLASDGMNMLPDDLKSVLVEVEKKTNNVGETESASSVTITADKLWLYSLTELCGNVDYLPTDSVSNDILNAEGTEYKLYRDMNVKGNKNNAILTKELDGDTCTWWERSPVPFNSYGFFAVSSSPSNHDGSRYSKGVAPGFCI